MSRGIGHVGRTLLAVLAEAATAGLRRVALDAAVYVRIYPDAAHIELKHRVTLWRAVRRLLRRPLVPAAWWALDSSRRPPVLFHTGDPQLPWVAWPRGGKARRRKRPVAAASPSPSSPPQPPLSQSAAPSPSPPPLSRPPAPAPSVPPTPLAPPPPPTPALPPNQMRRWLHEHCGIAPETTPRDVAALTRLYIEKSGTPAG